MHDFKPNKLPIATGHNLNKKFSDNDDILRDVSYAEVVRCLMYAMICNHPDIAYLISALSRFMIEPRKEQWNAIKGLLR